MILAFLNEIPVFLQYVTSLRAMILPFWNAEAVYCAMTPGVFTIILECRCCCFIVILALVSADSVVCTMVPFAFMMGLAFLSADAVSSAMIPTVFARFLTCLSADAVVFGMILAFLSAGTVVFTVIPVVFIMILQFVNAGSLAFAMIPVGFTIILACLNEKPFRAIRRICTCKPAPPSHQGCIVNANRHVVGCVLSCRYPSIEAVAQIRKGHDHVRQLLEAEGRCI